MAAETSIRSVPTRTRIDKMETHLEKVESSINKEANSMADYPRINGIAWSILVVLVLILGTTISWSITIFWDVPTYELKDGISLFALLFIMAQALERLMEPFTILSPWLQKPSNNEEAKEEETKKIEQQRTIVFWIASSFLAMLASAILGIFLLRTIGASTVPLWADIAITGLAVGAGTKPLHDLIKRIEVGKTA